MAVNNVNPSQLVYDEYYDTFIHSLIPSDYNVPDYEFKSE